MEYIVSYHTDVGTTKKTNQDSLAAKVVETKRGKVAFGVVCDGMGGLAKGELASKEVINALCDWFDKDLLDVIEKDKFSDELLVNQWNLIVQEQNIKLGDYGKSQGFMLGTTLSGILFIDDDYYIVHVGDSRIYEITDSLNQLTSDQTFIAREIAAGRMTVEQAKTDPRRSVLLQCVGASPVVSPEFIKGKIRPNTTYMICSDGFRHEISPEEIQEKLNPESALTEEKLKYGCMYLTEMVKNRGETDNVTVLTIKVNE